MQTNTPEQENQLVSSGAITLVGPLTTPLAITKPEHPVTKAYVLGKIGSGAGQNHTHTLATFVGAEALTASLGAKLSGLRSDVQNQINAKVKLSGGSLGASGLKITTPGSQPLAAITLAKLTTQVAEASSSGVSAAPGTIAIRNHDQNNAGWLNLDVASFNSKTQYADLYAAVGSTFEDLIQVNVLYQGYGMAGGGMPFANQYEWRKSVTINGSFQNTANLPFGLAQGQLIVTKSYVYYIGGLRFVDGTATLELSNNVVRFPINSDGTLGNGVAVAGLLDDMFTAPDSCFKIITILNKAYLFSGGIIYRSTINSDGTIKPFIPITNLGEYGVANSLYSNVFATKNTLYMIGGYADGMASNKIYTATISTSGSLGTFVESTDVLPEALSMPEIATVRNKVYLYGGVRSFSAGGYGSNKIYSATIGSNGKIGVFTDTTKTLPENLYYSFANIVTKNKIVIVGGAYASGGNSYPTQEITSITLDDNGDIVSTEKLTSQLQLPVARANALVLANKLHVIGGVQATHPRDGTVQALNGVVQTATLAESGLVDLSVFTTTTVNKLDGTNLHGTYVLGNTNPDPATLFRLPGIPCLSPSRSLPNGPRLLSGDSYYIKT